MPTSPTCLCQICLSEPIDDPIDRRTVERVSEHGFTIIAVGTGQCDECHDCDAEPERIPSFAYTIGLPHSAGHPELVVSGLRAELMQRMLGNAGARVLDGFRFEPGTTAENLIGFWPVVADPMSPQGLDETVLWSHWFHRRQVEALQLVWPSTRGIFTWQPGGSKEVASSQPQRWRLPQLRVGALAPDPEWPYPLAADRKVLACRNIALEGAPVHHVARIPSTGAEDAWWFLCPHDDHDVHDDLVPYHFGHLARQAPSLLELHDLAPGEAASRDTCWGPWRRIPLAA